jgi:hypothetical protein
MMLRSWVFVLSICPAVSFCQQEPGELSARALYYREEPDQDKLPPVPAAKPAAAPKSAATPKAAAAARRRTASPDPGPDRAAATPVIPVVMNLGLRYGVLLVDPRSGQADAVDPARVFKSGECIALEFEANRSGYLYVLEQGSSGKWFSLFPSAELSDESNIVRSRATVRVPARHCFEIEGVAGTERIFVVLSRNPEDLAELHQAIRSGRTGPPGPSPAPAAKSGGTLLAMNRLDAEIARFAGDLRSRDLRVKKVTQPEGDGERPNSVYVVNASTAPSDRVVTEVRIEHR